MEDLIVYEIDLDWAPDEVYINAQQNTHYIAWRIGTSANRYTGLWLISPVVDDPEPLETLLPSETVERLFTTDVNAYGHQRTASPNLNVTQLKEEFLSNRDLFIAEAPVE